MKNSRKTVKEWFWEKSNEIKWWWAQNKDWAVIIIPVAGGVVMWTLKKIISGTITSINLDKEERIKEMYVYDRSLGHYWKLRKKLSTNDWLEVDSRRRSGEAMGDILMDMRVI